MYKTRNCRAEEPREAVKKWREYNIKKNHSMCANSSSPPSLLTILSIIDWFFFILYSLHLYKMFCPFDGALWYSFLCFSSDTFVWLVINNLPCIVSCIDFYNGFGFFWTGFTIFHFLRPPVAPLHDSFSFCTMFLLFMLNVHNVRYCQYMHVFSYQSKNNCSA